MCIDFIHELKIKQSKLNGSTPQQLCVMATGGGAFKFYNRMKEVLHVDVVQEDEMECLIIGRKISPQECERLDCGLTAGWNRSRLLHHRNPPGGVYV